LLRTATVEIEIKEIREGGYRAMSAEASSIFRAPARGRVHVIGAKEVVENLTVVTGTFLLNGYCVSVLFGSGTDRSFISLEFKPLLNQKHKGLVEAYAIEYANGHQYEDSKMFVYRSSKSPADTESENVKYDQRRWIKLLSDYDCELKYHLGKANVVADALSRKEGLRPSRVRALGMTVNKFKTSYSKGSGRGTKGIRSRGWRGSRLHLGDNGSIDEVIALSSGQRSS
nr:reverse transcriptase domain-containing protein [Tanacetum cinerariifolium]